MSTFCPYRSPDGEPDGQDTPLGALERAKGAYSAVELERIVAFSSFR